MWHHRFNHKPMSANQMHYRGKQMTKQYREFRKWFDSETEGMEWPFEPTQRLHFVVQAGLSSKLADADNIFKPLCDTFQVRFDFNDRYIYKIEVEKEDVKKGQEYFDVSVRRYKGDK